MKQLIIVSDATVVGDDALAIALIQASGQYRILKLVATSGNCWSEQAALNLSKIERQLEIEALSTELYPSYVHQNRQTHYKSQEHERLNTFYAGALLSPRENHVHISAGGSASRDFFSSKPFDLLVIGPASYVANRLKHDGAFAASVGRVYLMGGALEVPGNASPTSEFNFWFDPESADELLSSGLDITLLPLDAVGQLSYPENFSERIVGQSPSAQFFKEQLRDSKQAIVCDEVLAALALTLSPVTAVSNLCLGVSCSKNETYGKLFIARECKRTVRLIKEINPNELWKSMLAILNGAERG